MQYFQYILEQTVFNNFFFKIIYTVYTVYEYTRNFGATLFKGFLFLGLSLSVELYFKISITSKFLRECTISIITIVFYKVIT